MVVDKNEEHKRYLNPLPSIFTDRCSTTWTTTFDNVVNNVSATNLIFTRLIGNADGTETRRSARRRSPHRRQRRQPGSLSSDGRAESVLVAQLHVARLPAREPPVLFLQLLLVSEIPGWKTKTIQNEKGDQHSTEVAFCTSYSTAPGSILCIPEDLFPSMLIYRRRCCTA